MCTYFLNIFYLFINKKMYLSVNIIINEILYRKFFIRRKIQYCGIKICIFNESIFYIESTFKAQLIRQGNSKKNNFQGSIFSPNILFHSIIPHHLTRRLSKNAKASTPNKNTYRSDGASKPPYIANIEHQRHEL